MTTQTAEQRRKYGDPMLRPRRNPDGSIRRYKGYIQPRGGGGYDPRTGMYHSPPFNPNPSRTERSGVAPTVLGGGIGNVPRVKRPHPKYGMNSSLNNMMGGGI